MRRHKITGFFLTIMMMGTVVTGCAGKTAVKTVEPGSVVHLQYSLTADNAAVVPVATPQAMKLTVGEGKLPPLFEKNLIGLPAGATKAIALKPEEAFGPVRKELIARVPRASLPAGELKEGMLLTAGSFSARIVKIMEDGSVVIDRNHPLAGKHLLYKVRVRSIE